MCDEDYWKNNYVEKWDEASEREKIFRKIIEENTKLKLEPVGLGAESNEFIHGSAEKNQNEKGAADYHAIGTNIYFEVTGPLSPTVPAGSPLWFRPDKIANAEKHLDDHDTFLINNFKMANRWYVIHFTKEFDEYLKKSSSDGTDCKLISKRIRGNLEKYIEIKSNNPYVTDLNSLIDYLNNKSNNNSQDKEVPDEK